MNRDINSYSNIIDTISKIKDNNDIKNIFWKSFLKSKPLPNNRLGSNIKILLLNAPCNGFGDVVFCLKIAKYLEKWYKADITIATTDTKSFNKIGCPCNITKLETKTKNDQCRRFKALKFQKNTVYDLIFVAPVQSDYSPSLSDVKYLIPYANKLNTFFFSEYNSYDEDDVFDFPTGIGGDKLGLLLTDQDIKKKPAKELENPYAYAYIADIDDAEICFISFVEMVAKKYSKKYKNFDIVIPESISYFLLEYDLDIIKRIDKYYSNILLIDKTKEYVISLSDKNDNILTFRADIFPVPYKDISSIIKHSVDDVLVTGDQSITDVLSCCGSKNIFYQIAGWKENFASELAKTLPNKYLSKGETSCGTLKAITYKSDYRDFIKKWDFRKLAKPKLDAIISSVKFKKDNKGVIEDLENIILKSRNIDTILTKINKYFNK